MFKLIIKSLNNTLKPSYFCFKIVFECMVFIFNIFCLVHAKVLKWILCRRHIYNCLKAPTSAVACYH